jgi:hypothetical protein
VRREGWTANVAADRLRTSVPTLYRIYNGDPSVSDVKLRAVEGGLDWPKRFLTYVIDGDIQRIEQLTGLRPDLRDWVLAELRGIAVIAVNDNHE